ncbi:hypothetical protein [Acetobacter okinawensis]|uniref:hypothetical protein n=1 Tax=Acetobacter okinawensis TaxID=1076594 RepID=UPI00209EBA3B|nr:hypothetical protein [Acetobacter okinawensis]MCP1214307.1 hypothetical protein [Acetobacter okinawensis]
METDLTLRDLLNRADEDEPFQIKLGLQTAELDSEKLEYIERAVEWTISEMVMHRKHKQGLSEDQRTVEIVSQLRALGLKATHDEEIGGHADIAIRLKGGFLWIAEAKNWRGCAWIFKGFRQLLTRYATGLHSQDNGAVLIYFEEENAKNLMEKWKVSLLKQTAITTRIIKNFRIGFRSEHTHKGTGIDFNVRHFAVPLYWNPEDK